MRTILDKKRIGLAAALVMVATVALAATWALRTTSPPPHCNHRGPNNEAVLECVAERAAETSPAPTVLILTLTGVNCLVGALLVAAKAVRRVMTLRDAAEQLQMPIGQVREWVNEGTLNNQSTDEPYVYVDREQVRHLERLYSAEVAAQGPTVGGG